MTKSNSRDDSVIYEDTLPGGSHWSMEMRRGSTLTLIDKEGGANVGMLFYNPRNVLERYNAPDTLKCQHTFKLGLHHCLYSDMGRIFCSIVDDSCGWHDTVCGNLSEALLEKKWGKRNYQQAGNDWTLSGEHSFLVELAKHGMGPRDMAANLNFFSRVTVNDKGDLVYGSQQSQAGQRVRLRFEMDTLVILHTCPHPLNSSSVYPKKPVTFQLGNSQPLQENDPSRNACEENIRGFENNRIYHSEGSL